jgi:hypothetical protein
MSENQSLLRRLEELLSQKKSKKFYAEKLGISEFEVNELMKELKEKDTEEVKSFTGERKVNLERGTIESTIISDYEPKDDIELAKLHKINLDKYIITNYWSKMLPSGKFTSSVFSKRKEAKDYSPEDFARFLENYKPLFESEIELEEELAGAEVFKKFGNFPTVDKYAIEYGLTHNEVLAMQAEIVYTKMLYELEKKDYETKLMKIKGV